MTEPGSDQSNLGRNTLPQNRVIRRLRRTRIAWLLALGVIVIPLGLLVRTEWSRYDEAPNGHVAWKATPSGLEIATLVLREGLECVLVLAAVTAGLKGAGRAYHPSIAAGVVMAFGATLVTWRVAARVLDDLGRNNSALALQAGTGLLAIVVLLVVMNWFFHKLYWTGWISLHQEKKQRLLRAAQTGENRWAIVAGMAWLGFTSFYREGFEVVLFLQSYRLRMGNRVVAHGVVWGMLASAMVAVMTFVAHRRLPYRRMLIVTGLMLAFVLLVMVGEEAQEMQLAGWLSATKVSWWSGVMPSWMDFWFSLIPTRESLGAQALAGFLVFGSYFTARYWTRQRSARAPN